MSFYHPKYFVTAEAKKKRASTAIISQESRSLLSTNTPVMTHSIVTAIPKINIDNIISSLLVLVGV
jgi:hypothetical protein